jgi:hypothetical protein
MSEKNAAVVGQWVLTALLTSTLVTANLTASKLAVYDIPVIGETTGSVAAVMIGVSFLLTDICGEIYGKQTTRRMVNSSIASVVAAFALVMVAVNIPAAPGYDNAAAFETVLSSSYPVLVASVLSLIVSQNIDVSVFHRIRSRTGRGHAWIRNVASTSVSQLVDTALFTALAFSVLPPLFGQAALPYDIIVGIIIAEYLIKLAFAVVDTAIFYAVTKTARAYGGWSDAVLG